MTMSVNDDWARALTDGELDEQIGRLGIAVASPEGDRTSALTNLGVLEREHERRTQMRPGAAPVQGPPSAGRSPPQQGRTFPLTWEAVEIAPGQSGIAPSLYMLSQGAHNIGAANAQSAMRMISAGSWRALIPARRAVELERYLNQLRALEPIPTARWYARERLSRGSRPAPAPPV